MKQYAIILLYIIISIISSCDAPHAIEDSTNNGNANNGGTNNGDTSHPADSTYHPTDSITPPADSSITLPTDTTMPADTISIPRDSTTINPTPEPPLSGNETTEYFTTTDTFPKNNEIWNGHVVAYTYDATNTSIKLLLISLSDWENMTSATNTTKPTTAFDIADQYIEGNLGGWSIPTADQARNLYIAFNTVYPHTLSETISIANGMPISTKINGNNIRYLCEDGTKTFGFYMNRIITAGATVKNYHLRLVKEVELHAQP